MRWETDEIQRYRILNESSFYEGSSQEMNLAPEECEWLMGFKSTQLCSLFVRYIERKLSRFERKFTVYVIRF